MTLDPVEHAARAIVQLGLAPQEEVDRHLEAWRSRPPGMGTVDDDGDLEAFLAAVYRGGLLSTDQYQALLGLMCGPAARTSGDPLLGQRFGPYVTQRKIGEGSMGKVYLAHRHDAPAERLVVKVLPVASDSDDVERFAREGEILATLRSPHVVRVYEGGRAGGYHYLAMEYVEGRTLQQLLEERRVFPWQSATRAVRQLALALATAHVMGVVHRDVKPHNVLVARDGTLKLCDFGIAKLVDHTFTSRAGQILGSPAYIAPEQWGDHRVDHRADLFAVGVIYYQLLTGRTPFHGKTPAEYAARIRAGEYLPVQGLRADLQPSVAHVVEQLLERDRRYRTPTAHALVSDLDRVLRGEAPDVPRLQRVDGGQPFPLLGASGFPIGAAAARGLTLDHTGAPAELAVIERTAAGLLLRVKDPEGVTINGQVVRGEVILKPGDALAVAPGLTYRYREGNLGGSGLGSLALSGESDGPLSAPDPVALSPPREAPGVLVAALEDAGHPLALLCCLEALDEATCEFALRESLQALEAAGLPPEEAGRVAGRARTLWRQRVGWIADRLFQATHENLGPRLEDWLGWWVEVADRYPLQVRPLGPRVRARLLITPPGEAGPPRPADLTEGESWELGRSQDCDVVLDDLSVSRRHVRLYRLISRYAYRDLGSRQGVRIGGQRRELGVLQPGESLELGRVRLRLAHLPPTERPARQPVERGLFTALVETRSRHVLAALVDLLDVDRSQHCCRRAAADFGLEAGELEPMLAPFLQVHRALASEALPAISRVNFGDDPIAWRAWLAEQELPLQVAPPGW